MPEVSRKDDYSRKDDDDDKDGEGEGIGVDKLEGTEKEEDTGDGERKRKKRKVLEGSKNIGNIVKNHLSVKEIPNSKAKRK